MSSSDSKPTKYKLKFLPEALQEWGKLDGSVKTTFKNLLRKRLDAPHVPGSALRGDLHAGGFAALLQNQAPQAGLPSGLFR